MKHIKDILTESLLDVDDYDLDKTVLSVQLGKKFKEGLRKRSKYPDCNFRDMLGRKIGVGDVGYALFDGDFAFVKVVGIKDPGKMYDVDYIIENLDGTKYTVETCATAILLIPNKHLREMVKIIS